MKYDEQGRERQGKVPQFVLDRQAANPPKEPPVRGGGPPPPVRAEMERRRLTRPTRRRPNVVMEAAKRAVRVR